MARIDGSDPEGVHGISRREEATRTETGGPPPAPGRLGPTPAGHTFDRGDAIGRYVVLETLGRGGMGVVYAAFDPQLDRRVAIKLLSQRAGGDRPGGHLRLLREAQALARLDDPHVVRVYDVGTWGGRVFLAMEYIAGRSLAAWLESSQRPRARVLEVFARAGRGLAAAHAVGLVHRDFKPSNVMVREDGHAVVLDFGLARSAGEPAASPRDEAVREALVVPLADLESESPEPLSPLASELTEAGARLGTPAYMAPEQWRGQPATAASDQFSFCVALYRALYGEPPFKRRGPDAPPSFIVRPAPEGPEVPAWLRRLLLRGLDERPQARFPSMPALLRALEADPARRRRRVLGGLAAATAIGALVLAWPRAAPVCAAPAERLEAVWGEARRGQLERAFTGTGLSYAPAVARAVGAAFDRYGGDWLDAHVEACEATHVRGEQSPALLDLRMACLDGRRRELGALVELLVGEPHEHLRGAVLASSTLSSLAACADVEALVAMTPPPGDPVLSARLDALRGELAERRALYDAGSFRRGLEGLEVVTESARELGYAPLLAESLLLQGAFHAAAGEVEPAAERLEQSLWWAGAGRHDHAAAEAFVRLVRVTGYQRGDFEGGATFVELARAVIRRLGRPGELEAALADHEAMLALGRGDLEAARAGEHRAIELKRRVFGDDHPAVARSLLRLGTVEEQAGRAAEARDLFARALAIQRRHLGDGHPDVAMNLDRLGTVERALGRLDVALEHHRSALDALEKSLGDHPHTAAALTHLGSALAASGDLAGAARRQAAALAVYERTLGAEHPHAALARGNLAATLAEAGHPREARRHYARTLEIQQRLHEDQHPWLATTRFNFAELLSDLGEHGEALALHRRALDAWRAAYGEDHPLIDSGLVGVGRALAGGGRCREALETLATALARLDRRRPRDAVLVGEAHFERARCLERLGQRAAALEQARLAESALEGVPAAETLLGEVRRWLAGS